MGGHNTETLLKYDNVKITSSKLPIPNCNEIKYISTRLYIFANTYDDQKLKKTTAKNKLAWRSNISTIAHKVLHFVLI